MSDVSRSSLPPSELLIDAPFVGREDELRALHAALDRALAGAGQLVLLVGEPGIGKTRTSERLASSARERGALVLWGSCYEWDGAPAYWPWTQALRTWLHHGDAEVRPALPADDLAILMRVIPEIASETFGIGAPASLDSNAHLFRLLTATGALIRNAATHQPLLIVLDDVHWADTPSLQLLRFLAQEIRDARVLIVATCRAIDRGRSHPQAMILADLVREPNCRKIALHGWRRDQVVQFVTLATGRAQPPALIDALFDETDGNPFFVGEVTRLLAAEGQFGSVPPDTVRRTRVPDGVRDAVRRRLDRLSPSCTHALAAASIIGRDFDVRLLERTTGSDVMQLLAALDEAVNAQFIVPGKMPDAFRFSHALIQDALYAELPSAERAQGHLAVGQALESRGAGHETDWAILARHFSLAAPFSDQSKVCDYSTRAGDAAMLQFNWEAAADHYRTALTALNLSDPGNDAHRCQLLISLGEALNRAGSGSGDVPEAREQFARAFALAQALGDAEQMARAAVGYAGINIIAAFGGPKQLEYLEAALAALGPEDHPLRSRVLSRLAVDRWNRDPTDRRGPRALATQAIEMARRLNAPILIAIGLWARYFASLSPAYLEEREADAAELLAYAEHTQDPIIAAWAYISQVVSCMDRGNLAGVEQMIAAMSEYNERAHVPYLALRNAAYQAMVDTATGRYCEAERYVDRAAELWQSSSPSQYQCQQFLLYRDLGRLAEFSGELRVPNHLYLWRFAAQAHRMALALERGQLDLARSDYQALLAADIVREPFDNEWGGVVARLAEATAAFDDPQGAALLSNWIAPYHDRLLAGSGLAMCHGPAALYLGHLAAVQRAWDAAVAHYRHALAMSERLGLRPFAVRALIGLAEVSMERNAPGDRVAGYAFALRAVALAESIGMAGLLPRAGALCAALAPLQPTATSRAGLTSRELDVLRLVAEGLSDADVARRLFLSRRTVNSHLTSIYAKLGVSSRTAAAHWAAEQKIV